MKRIVLTVCAAALLAGAAFFAGCKEENDHDHEWNAGEITKQATYTQSGEKLYVCKACGQTRKEAVEKLTFTADVTVKAGESISAAVKSAEDGDFILVKAGTYKEQLVVENKEVFIIGEGTVVVGGPEDYSTMKNLVKPAAESKNYAALGLFVGSKALVENISFTADPDKANIPYLTGENVYCGVASVDCALTLNYVKIKEITYPERPSGIQNGRGLFAAAEQKDKSLTVRYSEISGFNKTGAVVRAGVSELVFDGNTVLGAGQQSRNCQNGLQIECDKAEIKNNTIKNLVYSKEDEWKHASWGVLVYGAGEKGVKISANKFDYVDNGVYIVVNGSTELGENEYKNLYEEGYSHYETPKEGEEQAS